MKKISLGWGKTGVSAYVERDVKCIARLQGNKTYTVNVCIHCEDRSKAVHTRVEKPGICLRSRLLQPSEDLGARSTTGIGDWLTVLSSSLSPLNWGLPKEVWRKSRVCARALLCFQLFYLFWFSGKMEGEHRYCVLVYILYRTSPRFNRYVFFFLTKVALASLSLNCPVFLYRGNKCFLFLL